MAILYFVILSVAKGFTQKHKIKYLIYYEVFEYVDDAIQREKFIKGKNRAYKNELIKS